MKNNIKENRNCLGARRIITLICVFVLSAAIFVGMVNNIPMDLSMNSAADMGGPDLFGYRWYDSNAPSPTISYNWIEINSTGIDAGITGDDSYGNIPIGFNFEFYGTPYTEVNATTNGLIIFSSVISSYGDYGNDPVPSTVNPDNMLILFWDDLYDGGGTIFYETMGVTPNRQFVVQYDNWWTLGGSGPMKMQAILFEGGDIKYQYHSLGTASSGSASVGIENIDGTDGLQYSYNNAGRIIADLAIMFTTTPPPYLVNLESDEGSQFGDAGQVADHIITVNNVGTNDDTYDLSDTGVWPVVFRDIGDTTDITTLFVSSNTSEDFIARVTIPGGSVSGDYDITNIIATS